MTQDESSLTMWRSSMDFMDANQRRLSRYCPEEIDTYLMEVE